MPLNKLENFIKNTEGRILYVNPSDLDATDSIQNQGNSLSKPFRTVQRALIEAARFSYISGDNNDIVEKTTILLFPGEHIIDNRPGFAIKDDGGAKAVSPAGTSTLARDTFNLSPLTNFDLNQVDNVLYKFNSVYGGVIVPRGISIVGLDLRKTKIRPTYVPNPTDDNVKNTAIFRITGGCYFWQFSILDGDENKRVFTEPSDFDINLKASPTFSHHKLTAFEYADGVNLVEGFELTDLDMYYNKVSNAYNSESNRLITPKFPQSTQEFSKLRPEWEIVGAFASDPIAIKSVVSGDGSTATARVTVTTSVPHGLNVGTPIKIRGVIATGVGQADPYNVSTKVSELIPGEPTKFVYTLPDFPADLDASPGTNGGNATVTIETDTVSGASPYIFNVSMRSTWGMNGLHADGARASGFRSMVVAQFTAISLQKDDRAFVKYNPVTRVYDKIAYSPVKTGDLSSQSSQTNPSLVYHLDPNAIYRKGWRTSHIKMSNDAFVQIVSVFAIGFNRHFDARSGGDGSITNSNSNFGQLSLYADGFKKEAFDKDDKAFVTSIVAPRAISNTELEIDWLSIDVATTSAVGISSHLYLFGYKNADDPPPSITQGYRIGARNNDKLYVSVDNAVKEANIYMLNNAIGVGNTIAFGTVSGEKNLVVSSVSNSTFFTSTSHNLALGEKIRIISDIGDLPENIKEDTIYYAVPVPSQPTQLKISSSFTNASEGITVTFYLGSQLRVISRVSDKSAGDVGHPIQYDTTYKAWYVHSSINNEIYNYTKVVNPVTIPRTNITYVKRIEDNRSLDEKLYKLRVVIPATSSNARDPLKGYVIQDSSTTGARRDEDFTDVPTLGITTSDYGYNRNPRFISSCTFNSGTQLVTITSDLPHNLNVNDTIVIRNVTSIGNTTGVFNRLYNGTFKVNSLINDKTFTYSRVDVDSVTHSLTSLSTCTNNFNSRDTLLPRFEKSDNQGNLFIYRSEVISPFIQNIQDGIYYLYVVNASNHVTNEFTDLSYAQNIVNLYPQLDKDNADDNPASSISYAKVSPLGDVVTNDLKTSITRETVDKFYESFDIAPKITSVVSTSSTSATLTLSRQHGFAGVISISPSDLTAGTGYVNGTYYNVKLFDYGTTDWNGATAKVVVSSNSVSTVDIISGGSGYQNNDVLEFDSTVIGPVGTGASVRVRSSGISTFFNHVIQTTGLGTATDGYYRLVGVGTVTIDIAKGASDPLPTVGQYIINNGPVISISSRQTSSSGIATFFCNGPHGLVVGNRIRLIEAETDLATPNRNLGDYIVNERIDTTTFTVSNYTLSGADTPGYVLKHALSSNQATADVSQENLAVRDLFFYDNDYLILGEVVEQQSSFSVSSGISTVVRFPIGSYIQIDGEIMRVRASYDGNKLSVIRGALGSAKERHDSGSLIRKIKPIPVEFRRPSIIRASGHTFEYLGYGPGNYSTSLPQVQLKTLSEREDFLAQSQETACGSVVYTGMNSEGDFFIGNTKYSATSGEQTTFDIPTPTVTGQETSNLNVVYDEVIIKERLLVEGGNSGTVLSQFDGPVTFTRDVQVNGTLTLGSKIKATNEIKLENEIDSKDKDSGALIITGGLGVGQSVSIGGNLRTVGIASILSTQDSTSSTTGALVVSGGAGISRDLNVGFGASIRQNLFVTGVSTFSSTVRVPDGTNVWFGSGDNFRIYRNSANTQSFIDEEGTGDLNIRSNSNTIISRNTGTGTTLARFTQNVTELYYISGSTATKRLETSGIGVTITGELQVSGDITAFFTSDERLKDNIKPIEDPLAKVISISGNTFDWNTKSEKEGTDVGVIAQEIQKVLPEAVTERENGYLAVRYEKLVPLLIEAIKELKSEIDELKNQK